MKLRTLRVSLSLNVRSQEAWAVLSDFANGYRFNPYVSHSRLLRAPQRGVGARRRSDLYGNGVLVEEVTEWVEGERLTVELLEAPLPFDFAQVTLALAPLSGQATLARAELQYHPRYGVLGALWDRFIMRPVMLRRLTALLRGLEYHVLTGDTIGRYGIPEGVGRGISVVNEV